MRATTAVSLLVLIGFVAAARGVGNLYPVSQFPMYSGSAGQAAAHVMVLHSGAYEEVDSFQSLTCESLPALDAQQCEGAQAIPYLAREAEAFIRAHAISTSNGQNVELVLRVWSFDGKARAPHCVVTRCTGVPR